MKQARNKFFNKSKDHAKKIRPVFYSSVEVSSPPKDAWPYLASYPIGGYYQFFLRRNAKGKFVLYVGGDIEEPVFRVNHAFKTELEATLYIQFLIEREARGELD